MKQNNTDTGTCRSVVQASSGLGTTVNRLGGSRSGGVLVLALIAVVVAASLSVAFLQLSTSVTRRQVQSQDDKASFYMAEAGLAEAFCGMLQGKTGEVGSEASPAVYGDGLFWVEVVDVGGNLVRLDSTGMIGTGSVLLSLVAERGDSNVASLGVFSEQPMTIPPGSLIDAFDSRLGTYAAQEANLLAIADAILEQDLPLLTGPGRGGGVGQLLEEPVELVMPDTPAAKVGSAAGVSISGTEALPTVIRGDVIAGPNETVAQTGTVSISGAIENATESTALPVVVVPNFALSPSILHDGRTPLLIQAGQSHVPTMEAADGTQIVLEGPSTIVIDHLLLGASASLTLDTSEGPVELYVTQELTTGTGASIITSTQDPTDFSLQIAGTPANPPQIPAGSPLYGFIYAPQAKLILPAGLELFGGVIGNELEFQGPISLHFDQLLADISESSALPTYINWRLVEISQALQGGVLSMSPFERLGVVRAALLKPADSHADQWIKIQYLDGASALQNYSGMESAFDWTQVTETKNLERDGSQVTDNVRDDLEQKSALRDPVSLLGLNGVTNSVEKRDSLLASSPLNFGSLINMMFEEVNPMDSPDMRAVLEANYPLNRNALYDCVASGCMDGADLEAVLLSHSPGLANEVLNILAGVKSNLDATQLANVLSAQ